MREHKHTTAMLQVHVNDTLVNIAIEDKPKSLFISAWSYGARKNYKIDITHKEGKKLYLNRYDD